MIEEEKKKNPHQIWKKKSSRKLTDDCHIYGVKLHK
jgi:hypothetical protein